MNELIGLILIGIGVAFDFFGCFGLIRFPDIYNRLQGATKCVTVGTCTLLVGVAVYSGHPAVVAKALICAVFILLTSPVAAHALARGAHISGIKLWRGSVMDKYEEEVEHEKPDSAR